MYLRTLHLAQHVFHLHHWAPRGLRQSDHPASELVSRWVCARWVCVEPHATLLVKSPRALRVRRHPGTRTFVALTHASATPAVHCLKLHDWPGQQGAVLVDLVSECTVVEGHGILRGFSYSLSCLQSSDSFYTADLLGCCFADLGPRSWILRSMYQTGAIGTGTGDWALAALPQHLGSLTRVRGRSPNCAGQTAAQFTVSITTCV